MLRVLVTILLICLSSVSFAALPAAVDGKKLPSLAPMLERATPAVVNISTVASDKRIARNSLFNDPFFSFFFDRPRNRPQKKRSQSLGSGVIVDADKGHILTNHHVIEDAKEIKVTLKDGRQFTAQLLGVDPEIDIAVLRIPANALTAVRYADSDQLKVGDFVVAIGNPFGLSQTVTSGIVSALGRSGLGIEGYENFIQTDASINPGNSGGPLVNLRGELIGINTAILAPNGGNVGIGFAIPSNMAQAISQQIITHGRINRGVFGTTVQSLTYDLATALNTQYRNGAVVSEVKPSSAADQAGLRAGDLIIELNHRKIVNATDFNTQLALLRINDDIRLSVIRDSKKLSLSGRIANPYADYTDGEEINTVFKGTSFKAIIDDSQLGKNAGIAVGPVEEDSYAWNMGLRDDDVIFHINRVRVKSIDLLKKVVEESDGVWQLKLRRGNRLVTLVSR